MCILNKNVELVQLVDKLTQLKFDLEKTHNERKAFYIDVSDIKFQSADVEKLMRDHVKTIQRDKVIQVKFFSDTHDLNIFLQDNPFIEYIDIKILDVNNKYLIYKE